MLLIIGAMEEELNHVLKNETYQEIQDNLGKEYHSLNHKYLIVISNIGLTNASLSLSHWLTKYPQINQILVLGTAGSMNPNFKQGDECYIDKAIYGLADVTVFGYNYGQIPKMPVDYSSIKNPSFSFFLKKNPQLKKANIVSLDVFIDKKKQINFLEKKINRNFDLVDMETTAFLHVAYCFKKPILVLKIISDSIYEHKDLTSSFDEFLPKASSRLAILFHDFLEKSGLL